MNFILNSPLLFRANVKSLSFSISEFAFQCRHSVLSSASSHRYFNVFTVNQEPIGSWLTMHIFVFLFPVFQLMTIDINHHITSLLPAKRTQSLIVRSENNPVRGRVGKQAVEGRVYSVSHTFYFKHVFLVY